MLEHAELLVLVGAVGAAEEVHHVEDTVGVAVHRRAGQPVVEKGGVAVRTGRDEGKLADVTRVRVDHVTER